MLHYCDAGGCRYLSAVVFMFVAAILAPTIRSECSVASTCLLGGPASRCSGLASTSPHVRIRLQRLQSQTKIKSQTAHDGAGLCVQWSYPQRLVSTCATSRLVAVVCRHWQQPSNSSR